MTEYDEAITKAREKGHDPILLTKSGAMELWVCKLCGRPMELPNMPCPGEGNYVMAPASALARRYAIRRSLSEEEP